MTEKVENKSKNINIQTFVSGIILAIVLFYISRQNYLLFHTVAEIFSIFIACGIFMFAWNSRNMLDNDYLLFLGITFLFVGGIDLLHALAYKGMGVFPGKDANLPTQLWILGRYFESFSLLIAPILLSRKINIKFIFFSYFCVLFLLLMTIFYWQSFPVCFVEGTGLTPFKKISEYIISLILLGALIFLYQNRNRFNPKVFQLLFASILITIFAELAFTFYVNVYGLSNLVGHYFKIISYFLIYMAIIDTGLKQPYLLLFRELQQSENDLKKALSEIKTLYGIIPICSYCKKIRDDKGAWDIMEAYITEHTHAKFSHGACPECLKEQLKYLEKLK